MPLLALWTSNPAAIGEFTVEQAVTAAGDGNLKDGSSCSEELRKYLAQIPSSKLSSYVEHCLSSSFSKGGMVLQDLVNARRLDYVVTNGRYQGTSNTIGFDGIWVSPEGQTVIAEVKTTDTYRISLETIAGYRQKLLEVGQVNGNPSILIVVGRQDTGELEAQIRGSRHAWDIRLISADALIKLVQLKENAEAPETGRKIRSLLAPMEYTRLDPMVDVMFTTVTDVEGAIVGEDDTDEPSVTDDSSRSRGVWQFTDSRLLQRKREDIIAAMERAMGANLIKKSRALYWDAAHEKRIASTISKRYTKRASYPYWFAYHPAWDDFLREGKASFLVLGWMDLTLAFSIPWERFHPLLDALNTTTTENDVYWHLHLTELRPGAYALLLPKRSTTFPLSDYQLSIG